jgi:hypothetical protein
VIVEDESGNYLDRNAYNAAYEAVTPYYQHAQMRGWITEKVVAAVIGYRTRYGVEALSLLTTDVPSSQRGELVYAIRDNLEGANAGSLNPIEAAVKAAANALTSGEGTSG